MELYHRRDAPYYLIHACEVKTSNLRDLAALTQGAIHGVYSCTKPAPGVTLETTTYKVTFLGPGKTGAHDAVIGDYVVSDMAGGFIAVDKEMFETHYTKE